MPQNELRDQIIEEFKRGKLKYGWILVVTRWANKDPEFRYELNALATLGTRYGYLSTALH